MCYTYMHMTLTWGLKALCISRFILFIMTVVQYLNVKFWQVYIRMSIAAF